MTPSIETRLQAIIGALEHLILPALAGADPIVQEQAALSLGHLRVIAMQLPHVEVYHAICLAEQLRLGDDLIAAASGGPTTKAAADALRTTLAAARNGSTGSARDVRNQVAAAIDDLVIASSHDGAANFLTASHCTLLDHGQRQAARDRAWYGPTGLDPFVADLPSIPDMVAAESAVLREEAHA